MAIEPKVEGAFLTIGELADELGLPHHILRYWETRFPQLKPLQRAGNRRYYRPEDAALAREINRLLYQEGYTVKGVQKLLGTRPLPASIAPTQDMPTLPSASPPAEPPPARVEEASLPLSILGDGRVPDDLIAGLKQVRARLANALARHDATA